MLPHKALTQDALTQEASALHPECASVISLSHEISVRRNVIRPI